MLRERTTPWLGCGVSGSWNNVSDALEDTDLMFKVEQVDAWDDRGQKIPGILVNRRTDTKEILGSTSDKYGVIQNKVGFSLMQPFLDNGGVIEHMGVTEQGMYFAVARFQYQVSFGEDPFDLYVCMMNSFNGKFPLALIITPVRVFCQNLFRKLMHEDMVMHIKHGSLANERIWSVSEASDIIMDYQHKFMANLQEKLVTKRTTYQVKEFIAKMFPYVPADNNHPRHEATNERVDQLRTNFFNSYYMADDNYDYLNTKLGVINAYFDWTTHHESLRGEVNQDARLGGLLTGKDISTKLLLAA